MVHKVKNISGEEVQFETFSLALGEVKDLTWDSSFMSPATFGKMLCFYNLDKVSFQDENGADLNTKKNSAFQVVDDQGNESEEIVQVPEVKILLNELYNNM